jgi:serine protease AprX
VRLRANGSTAHGKATASVASVTEDDVTAHASIEAAEPSPVSDRVLEKLDAGLQAAVRGQRCDQLRVIARVRDNDAANRLAAIGLNVIAVDTHQRSLVIEAAPEEIAWLAAQPDTIRMSTDAVVTPHQAHHTDGPTLKDTLGLLPGGGITTGGSSYAGNKIVVGIIDSGIEPSKDLHPNRILAFYDVTSGSVQSASPNDAYGHGTHVAGLIGGSGDLSSDHFEGAASKATFIGYKVLDGSGVGYTSNVILALDHAAANKHITGLDLINLSLGHPVMEPAATDPLVQAVERAVRAGIIVVVSAGNHGINAATGAPGYGGITSPGNAPSAITVGAIDINQSVTRGDDFVQAYSSRGPTWFDAYVKPDIVAPGHRLVASAATDSALFAAHPELRVTAAGQSKSQYLRLSGTSMAAAVTTGVIAAGLEAFQSNNHTGETLTANMVKGIVQFTAFEVFGSDALMQGAGSLNPQGAIRFMGAVEPSLTIWDDSGVTPRDSVDGQWLSWSQQLIWGNQIIWGSQIIWGNQTIWGTQTIWGNQTISGNQIIWGNQISWGSSVVWGNQIIWGNNNVWGNNALTMASPSGALSGQQIIWGNVDPATVTWMMPASADVAGSHVASNRTVLAQ